MSTNPHDERALLLHKKLGGKIRVTPAAKVKDRSDLALVYTPGVGAVSTYVAKHPEEARQYTMKGRTIAVLSDGSAVLGLGNIGPLAALPVMEGKAVLFKEFAGVDAVPLVLATQDADEIVKTIVNISPAFGGINLEDISAPRCFDIEKRLIEALDIPVMHDDQHGTAIVVLAGLINALLVTKRTAKSARVVIVGAGAAGVATAGLISDAGIGDIIMVDSKGIISRDRTDLAEYKRGLVEWTNKRNISGTLQDALVSSDVFIGVSAPGLITAEDVKTMAKDPIIFALSNPTPEIMPDEAKRGGARVIATGRSDFPNQVNNALVFPGVFRGALDNKVKRITPAMKLKAARALAKLVTTPTPTRIIPGIFDKRAMRAVAAAIK